MRVTDTTCSCTEGGMCTDNDAFVRVFVFNISTADVGCYQYHGPGARPKGEKANYYPLPKDEKTVYKNP